MAALRICEYGEPILRKKCLPVEAVCEKILQNIEDMCQTLYQEQGGVGLAAPQVGLDKRLIVIDIGQGLWQLINPKIISRRGESIFEEGCLSLPGIQVWMKRAKEVTVEALNTKGEKIIIEGKDFFSHVLQHEIDHLNGILIIDSLDRKKRKEAEEKLRKWIKETPRM